MVSVKKEYALDIFRTLESIDKNNMNYYSSLNPEEKKAFFPKVVMRWLSSVENNNIADDYIILTNNLVNINLWKLDKHPELVYKLMSIVGIGRKQRHTWIPENKNTTNTTKLDNILLNVYQSINDTELDIIKSKLTKEKLVDLLKNMGLQDNEVKPILEDFKKLSNARK